MDAGIKSSQGREIATPLPQSWLGRPTAPPNTPSWARISTFSAKQLRCLVGQIGYDQSQWDYSKVGVNNQLGRYQFNTELLEAYGLLASGSNLMYGTDCVNYLKNWSPAYNSTGSNSYQNYFHNTKSLGGFLSSIVAQEHLAYQHIVDLYLSCIEIGTISEDDPIDVKAGMIYVAWTVGVGAVPSTTYPSGSGTWAWRYFNVGEASNSFNSGRYAITVLSA